jgi:hypothetical protein
MAPNPQSYDIEPSQLTQAMAMAQITAKRKARRHRTGCWTCKGKRRTDFIGFRLRGEQNVGSSVMVSGDDEVTGLTG